MNRILITAFEPFGGSEKNASAEVLRLLPDRIGGAEVLKMLLPVVFGKAAEKALRQEADAVFLLGEAGGRDTVTPEKKAKNLRDARIPDNEGNQPKTEKILPGTAEEIHAGFSVDRIVKQMRKEGVSVSASEDAGSYVCNDTFYLAASGSPAPVEFIHCPAIPENAPEYASVVERFIALALSELRMIQNTVVFIEDLFRNNSDGHGTGHSMRVYRTALEIAETEPAADRFIVSLGALLHDADDYKLFDTENNANARRFLASQGLDPDTAEQVCAVINSVSFSKNKGKRPDTLEAQIVQDADRLDAIGAVGIARTFAFGGKHSRSLESSVGHFHEKLLLLKDLMNTAEAKKIAESRHAFMELFLKEWDQETGSKKTRFAE